MHKSILIKACSAAWDYRTTRGDLAIGTDPRSRSLLAYMTKVTTRRAIHLVLGALVLSGCNSAPAAQATMAAQASGDSRALATFPQQSDAAALRSAAPDPATRRFYDENGWRPVWSEAAGHALEQALAGRSAHGLDHINFLERSKTQAGPAQREVALTRGALRYAAALAGGMVDPTKLHEIYTIPRPQPDLSKALAQALDRGDVAQWLAGLAPQDAEYAELSKAYLSYRSEARPESRPAIAATRIIHPGDRDDRIPAIAQQLIEGEYLPERNAGPSAPASGEGAAVQGDDTNVASASAYTPQMVSAVKQLQRDFGIAADGAIGPHTLAILNLGPGDRAQALAVAMERRRWLSRTPPATRIDVNIAASRLRYFRDGNVVDSRKVIVGKPGKETPQLLAPIYRLVANPTWTIPKSIQRGEMAGVSNAYLRRHDMVRRNGWIVQQPGPHNALGLVKFDMKDDQAIYLHDTSAPSLFGRSQRHLSHGCVRVDDAPGFAALIARDEGVTTEWKRARASGRQSFVALPHGIPVRLLYHNVFVDDSGRISFRTDPYGWNAAVAQALGFGGATAARVKPGAIDLGP